jgi:hypothetical protein
MAKLLARVEMHNASARDYDALHEMLARQGFDRRVQAGNGSWYQLPTGTYVHPQSQLSPDQGRAAVYQSAKSLHPNPFVIVVDWDAGSWVLPEL